MNLYFYRIIFGTRIHLALNKNINTLLKTKKCLAIKVRPSWEKTDLKSPFKGSKVQGRGSSCCHHFEETEVTHRKGSTLQEIGQFKDFDKISKQQNLPSGEQLSSSRTSLVLTGQRKGAIYTTLEGVFCRTGCLHIPWSA